MQYCVSITRHLNDSKASYQNLTDDLQRSEIITKSVESVIASSWVAIAKVQALIQDNEKKLANEKKRANETEAARNRLQQKLNVRSSQLEVLQTQLATKKLLSDEELRVLVLAEVEEAWQRNIQHFKTK